MRKKFQNDANNNGREKPEKKNGIFEIDESWRKEDRATPFRGKEQATPQKIWFAGGGGGTKKQVLRKIPEDS